MATRGAPNPLVLAVVGHRQRPPNSAPPIARARPVPSSPLPAKPDDAGGDESLEPVPDRRVLRVILEGGRVALGLLEDALHDGILQDADDLKRT